MAEIDYKNRAILFSQAYSSNGTADVELYFDRFDKVMYFTDLNGGYFYTDGTVYTPTPIPDGNRLIYCSLYNGIVAMKFINPVNVNLITEDDFTVQNGTVTYVTAAENDTLLLFTMTNSDTLLITSTLENMVGDITTTTSIAALPGIYKAFDTQEDLCSYYAINGETMPDPDGEIFIDYSASKSYLDKLGQTSIATLTGKWIYIITTSVPNDTEGGMEPAGYLYAEVTGEMTPNAYISELCV